MTFKELRNKTIAEGEKAARLAEERLRELYPNGQMPEEDVRTVLSPILRKLHDKVNALTSDAIEQMNQRAGIGMKPIDAEYDIEQENKLVAEMSRRSFEDGFSW